MMNDLTIYDMLKHALQAFGSFQRFIQCLRYFLECMWTMQSSRFSTIPLSQRILKICKCRLQINRLYLLISSATTLAICQKFCPRPDISFSWCQIRRQPWTQNKLTGAMSTFYHLCANSNISVCEEFSTFKLIVP